MAKACALETVASLERLHKLLSTAGEKQWMARVGSVLSKIECAGVVSENVKAEMKTWFGGMGSINDLMISACNDHAIEPEAEEETNEKLREEISKLWALLS